MEEHGRLQSMGLRALPLGPAALRALPLGPATLRALPLGWDHLFLPGESQGRGSLVGFHLWGRTESDTTEAT